METMKANHAVITSANMDRVTFDVTIHGGVKDQGARTNWNILDLDLTLTGNTVTTKELVLGYIASGRFWIKIQGWLRKLSATSQLPMPKGCAAINYLAGLTLICR